jgi:anti-anti-sigma factor
MQIEQSEGVTRITLSENLVASKAKEMKAKLKALIDEGNIKLVIDMQGVESIDSSGIGVLVATQNSIKSKGEKLTIENASEKIFRMMKTMRLDKHMHVKQA